MADQDDLAGFRGQLAECWKAGDWRGWNAARLVFADWLDERQLAESLPLRLAWERVGGHWRVPMVEAWRDYFRAQARLLAGGLGLAESRRLRRVARDGYYGLFGQLVRLKAVAGEAFAGFAAESLRLVGSSYDPFGDGMCFDFTWRAVRAQLRRAEELANGGFLGLFYPSGTRFVGSPLGWKVA